MRTATERLIQKGVQVPSPGSVEIGEEIDIDRIAANGVVIHAGSRIFGKDIFIAPGAQIGVEAPVTIESCFIGPDVSLNGGYFKESVFLNKASCGSGSHVRQGTILEEHSSIAHTVGLKQTILFPYVTLGSLINFCDCLMAGGTDRKNHSEVGSSYIHFNYTPNQDKATASLIGDVPRGVMLNQSPIFLGGQGGLVGPCRIEYGVILGAGSICRKDQLKPGMLIFEATAGRGSIPFQPGIYRNVKRILNNNFHYIGNLLALQQWYRHIRSLFAGPELPPLLLQGLKATLLRVIDERIGQLEHLSLNMGSSQSSSSEALQDEFCREWPEIKEKLQRLRSYNGAPDKLERFLPIMERKVKSDGKSYLDVIKRLTREESDTGTKWLESIVQRVLTVTTSCLPSMQR